MGDMDEDIASSTFSSLMWHGCSSTNWEISPFISVSLSSMALDTLEGQQGLGWMRATLTTYL